MVSFAAVFFISIAHAAVVDFVDVNGGNTTNVTIQQGNNASPTITVSLSMMAPAGTSRALSYNGKVKREVLCPHARCSVFSPTCK